jgi:hypothetical protein
MQGALFQKTSLILFLVALIHTFIAPYLLNLKFFKHKVLHYLTEVEGVFVFWAIIFLAVNLYLFDAYHIGAYLQGLSFIEPLFVWVMLLICSCKPLLEGTKGIIQRSAEYLTQRFDKTIANDLVPYNYFNKIYYILILGIIPLLGSLITEVAAMTLAAIMLKPYFKQGQSKLRYLTITALCLNISIAGGITPFAAPPVLMVANIWGWDLMYMLQNFAWRAILGVFTITAILTYVLRDDLQKIDLQYLRSKQKAAEPQELNAHQQTHFATETPFSSRLFGLYILFLIATILLQHHVIGLIAIFILFLVTHILFKVHHQKLLFKEASLIALFLSGLMILGKAQAWWVQDLLAGLSHSQIFSIGFALSAVMDNAAITYLASLIPNTTPEFKYNIVAAALSAAGLSVLANAPNLLALGLLKKYFKNQTVSHLKWFLYSIPVSVIAVLFFLI